MVSFFQLECFCLRELYRLVARDIQYLTIVLPLYVGTLHSPLRCQMFRATYFLCRHIDDVLDGDLQISADPDDYVSNIQDIIRKEATVSHNKIEHIAAFVVRKLSGLTDNKSDPVGKLETLIAAMRFDLYRANNALLLNRAALVQHHADTFASILDIALCITGSLNRACEFQHLIEAQRCLYSLQDIEEDLSRNIINIPEEVIESFSLDVTQGVTLDALTENRDFQQWYREELENGIYHVQAVEKIMRQEYDGNAKMFVKPILRDLKAISRLLLQRPVFQSRANVVITNIATANERT